MESFYLMVLLPFKARVIFNVSIYLTHLNGSIYSTKLGVVQGLGPPLGSPLVALVSFSCSCCFNCCRWMQYCFWSDGYEVLKWTWVLLPFWCRHLRLPSFRNLQNTNSGFSVWDSRTWRNFKHNDTLRSIKEIHWSFHNKVTSMWNRTWNRSIYSSMCWSFICIYVAMRSMWSF